jgi:protein-histidine pros-kinase
MRRIGPDTLFSRLFALLLGVVIASHLSVILSFAAFTTGMVLPPGATQVLVAPGSPSSTPIVQFLHPEQVVWKALGDLWPVMGMMLLVLVLAAWFGAAMVAAPIRRLSDAAAGLADNLDSPPIAEAGPREARRAARIFNRMQDRISAQLRQRSVFLAAVSHDLRTPLTRLKLRVERVDDPDLKDRLRGDLNEMASLLNAALDVLRGEVDSEPWQLFDVQALADSLAEDAGETGRTVTVCGHALPLMAQPTLLRRCLSNLIENALRYGQSARVILKEEKSALIIDVEDDGPGIPEDKLTAVCEPFVRLESSRNKSSGGVGLGLSIAREAAVRHGGTLTLHNREEGGLVARLFIPRHR